MHDEFRESEGRIPSVTPALTLWLLSIVAVAGAGFLVLATPGPGTQPDAGPVASAPFSATGGADPSARVASTPEPAATVAHASPHQP